MRDLAPSSGRPVLNKPRARKEAARVLAVSLQTRYRKFLESAGDENATVIASADLAQCMYENIEFVMWALKSIGGMNPPPPEEIRKPSAPQPMPANDDPRFTKPPEFVLEDDTKPGVDLSTLPCSCEPVHDALLKSMRHATNCPKHEPA